MVAMRLSDDTVKLLRRLRNQTQKTQTRIIEEAVYLHGKDLKAA